MARNKAREFVERVGPWDGPGPYCERAERSLNELIEYINQNVGGEPAELFVSREGESHLPALHHLELKVSELAQRTDWLEERTHVALVAS